MTKVIKFDKDANLCKEASKALKHICQLLTNHFNEDITVGNVRCHFHIPLRLKDIFLSHYAMEVGYVAGLCLGRAHAIDEGNVKSAKGIAEIKYFLDSYNDKEGTCVALDTKEGRIFLEMDEARCKVLSCSINGYTLCSKVFDKLVTLGGIEPYQFFQPEGIDKIIKGYEGETR